LQKNVQATGAELKARIKYAQEHIDSEEAKNLKHLIITTIFL
jgi:hypothetical protein